MSDIVRAGGLALTKTRIALLQAIADGAVTQPLGVLFPKQAAVLGFGPHAPVVTARVDELVRAGLAERQASDVVDDAWYALTPAGEAALKAAGGAS